MKLENKKYNNFHSFCALSKNMCSDNADIHFEYKYPMLPLIFLFILSWNIIFDDEISPHPCKLGLSPYYKKCFTELKKFTIKFHLVG